MVNIKKININDSECNLISLKNTNDINQLFDRSQLLTTGPLPKKYGSPNLLKIVPVYNVSISTNTFINAPSFNYFGEIKVTPGKTYAFIGLDAFSFDINGGVILCKKNTEFVDNPYTFLKTISNDLEKVEGYVYDNILKYTVPDTFTEDENLYIVFIMSQSTSYGFMTYDHTLTNFISVQLLEEDTVLDFKTLPTSPYNYFKDIKYEGNINVFNPEKHYFKNRYNQRSSNSNHAYVHYIHENGAYKGVMIPVIPGVKYTIKTENDTYHDDNTVIGVAVRDIDLLCNTYILNNGQTYQPATTNMRINLKDCPVGKNGIGRTVTIPFGYNTLIFNIQGVNPDISKVKVCVGEEIIEEEFKHNHIYGNRYGLFSAEQNEIINTNLSWCTLGDSITWINENRDCGYQRTVFKKYKFSNYINHSVNGGTMVSYATSLKNGTTTLPKADIYTIFYGINDWGKKSPVGTLDDFKNNTGANTYSGALRVIIDKIYQTNINAYIFIMTPRKAYGFNNYLPEHWDSSLDGVYLKEYINVLKECAKYYSLPIIDVFEMSQANERTLANLSYDTALHPNQKGCDLIAALIINKFKECIPL